jgi:hypothetical protein
VTTTKQRLDDAINLKNTYFSNRKYPATNTLYSVISADFKCGANLLAPLLLEMVDALECHQSFHRLGGIDDCKPCLAKRKFERFLNENR